QHIFCRSRAIPPLQPVWQKLFASLCGSYCYVRGYVQVLKDSSAALCVPRMQLRARRGSTRSRCARISERCLSPKDILSTSDTDVKGDNVRVWKTLIIKSTHIKKEKKNPLHLF
ncbi:unnamed protein product, partial [Bubo scandiacus]